MTLAVELGVGTRIGAYEIRGSLGAGGMGVVYHARDTRLNRDAALKVLPDAFTADAERVARFQREAQVLASLNHPNIAAIYGFEEVRSEAGTIHALVMELVDGETLRCPQPLTTALDYARQIAEALEYAHERGIIHRDLKPDNLKVTVDGVVKVLDFGLAKAIDDRAGSTVDLTHSPTLSLGATTAGVIVGTAPYMSPEQASGKAADRRADIWSFGTVLYEMLTGRRAFAGESVSDTLASVLKLEPDWSRLPGDTPAAMRRLLERCLTKDRRQRLQAIGDARLDIDDAQRAPRHDLIPSRRQVSTPVMVLSVLAAMLAGAATMLLTRPATPAPPETRLEVATPPTSQPSSFALSPDGRQLVFVAASEAGSQLWLRSLASAEARPLARTEGAVIPFWSPNSRSIAFFADQKLKRIDLDGGAVQVVADAIFSLGGSWNADDVILFARSAGEPIQRVSAKGGPVTSATKLETLLLQSSPRFLPDGRQFLFWSRRTTEATGAVFLGSLDGTDVRRLVDADSTGEISASGELLFVRQETLFAASFDADRGMAGTPLPVAEGVLGRDIDGRPSFSASPAGPIAYRSSSAGGGKRQFAWFDRSGRLIENVGPPDSALVWQPSLSPDEARAVMWRVPGSGAEIWMLDLRRELISQFSFGKGLGLFASPVWSPDGRRIVFMSFLGGMYEQSVDAGAAEPRLIWKGVGQPSDWSSDGRFILFAGGQPQNIDVMALPMDGDRTPVPVVTTGFNENNAKFSPDQRWIVYRSERSGRSEVFIRPFLRSGGDVQVSTNGGAQPRWSRNGKEVFYIGLDGKLMAVPVEVTTDGARATAGQPVALFDSRVGDVVNLNGQQYDVSRDGKRFFIATMTEEGGSPIVVISNWRGNR